MQHRDPYESKRRHILDWLREESGLAEPLPEGGGFSVNPAAIIEPRSGRRTGVCRWLLGEGFTDGQTVGRFIVRYEPATADHGTKLSFHCHETPAPSGC